MKTIIKQAPTAEAVEMRSVYGATLAELAEKRCPYCCA